jgi:hypothetical protein
MTPSIGLKAWFGQENRRYREFPFLQIEAIGNLRTASRSARQLDE